LKIQQQFESSFWNSTDIAVGSIKMLEFRRIQAKFRGVRQEKTEFDTLSDFFFAENDAHPKSKP